MTRRKSALVKTARLLVVAASFFLLTMPLAADAAGSLKSSNNSKYPSPSMAFSGEPNPHRATQEGNRANKHEATTTTTTTTTPKACSVDGFFTKLFDYLADSWTKFQMDASATMTAVTRNVLGGGMVSTNTDFTIFMDQLQETLRKWWLVSASWAFP